MLRQNWVNPTSYHAAQPDFGNSLPQSTYKSEAKDRSETFKKEVNQYTNIWMKLHYFLLSILQDKFAVVENYFTGS